MISLVLRPRFELNAYEDELDQLVDALVRTGATVLTSTFRNMAWRLLPARLRANMRSRLQQGSDVVRRVATGTARVLGPVKRARHAGSAAPQRRPRASDPWGTDSWPSEQSSSSTGASVSGCSFPIR